MFIIIYGDYGNPGAVEKFCKLLKSAAINEEDRKTLEVYGDPQNRVYEKVKAFY